MGVIFKGFNGFMTLEVEVDGFKKGLAIIIWGLDGAPTGPDPRVLDEVEIGLAITTGGVVEVLEPPVIKGFTVDVEGLRKGFDCT